MDLIMYNGNFITVDRTNPTARSLAVKDGIIKAVGVDSAVLSLRGNGTEIMDLRGKTVVPGFNDSHMHLLSYAQTRNRAALGECASIGELTVTLDRFIRDNRIENGGWVFGWGWDQTMFRERRLPTRKDLDRVSTEHYLVIMRTCGHICAVNSKALHMAGISGHAPVMEGGCVDTDTQGLPTGVLREKAMYLVMGMFTGPDKDTVKKLILGAAGDFLRSGLTTVQTDDLATTRDGQRDVMEAYEELDRAGKLPIRINKQLRLPTMKRLKNFLRYGYRTGDGSDFFRIGPLKIMTDGSLGGRTAYIFEPYSDAPGDTGIPLYAPGELNELVECAYANGLQVSGHAIGDRAVAMLLDAYEAAHRKYPRDDPRFRVIHASMVSRELLDRFRAGDIIADIQPSFVPSDMPFVVERLNPERVRWVYCWRDFLDREIRISGGSDCPVETFEPLAGLQAAVARDGRGAPPGGWMPEQKLTVEEALEIFTLGSAYSAFEENSKGSLTPGKLADMVVLEEDIRRVNPDEIRDVPVLMTLVGGKTAYRRD